VAGDGANMNKWHVTHALAEPALMKSREPGFPELGLTFEYDAEGRLCVVNHDFASVESEENKALRESTTELRLFWEALEFAYGYPLHVRSRTAHLVSSTEPESGPRASFRGEAHCSANGIVVKPIVLPKPGSLTAAHERLKVRLSLANQARDLPDTDAIRVYFVILEDVHIRIKRSVTGSLGRVACIRDFVSHGKVTKSPVTDLIELELGPGISQFDPTDDSQQRLVSRYRELARDLVIAELERAIW
jgi:hypothetical protein